MWTHLLEIVTMLAGAFLLGMWSRSFWPHRTPKSPEINSERVVELERQLASMQGKLQGANRSIAEYINREIELKQKLETLFASSTGPDNQQARQQLDGEIDESRRNLELAAQIIEQLRSEVEQYRILPNHMDAYMSALTEANAQVMQLKNELEESRHNLAAADTIISQLQNRIASTTTGATSTSELAR